MRARPVRHRAVFEKDDAFRLNVAAYGFVVYLHFCGSGERTCIYRLARIHYNGRLLIEIIGNALGKQRGENGRDRYTYDDRRAYRT